MRVCVRNIQGSGVGSPGGSVFSPCVPVPFGLLETLPGPWSCADRWITGKDQGARDREGAVTSVMVPPLCFAL